MRRIALCLLLAGCGEESTSEEAAVPDAAPCGAEQADGDCGLPPQADAAPPDAAPVPALPRLSVIDTLGFATETAPGVAPGFDVDGRVSDARDADGCNKADLRSPEGTPGIDNALARLVPLFSAAGLGAAESLGQSLIEEGGLLLMVQIDGVDDLLNDDDVTMRLRAGDGEPLLGTDGRLLSGQTFDLHADSPESLAPEAHIVDGWIEAGPFEGRLPILAFGLRYDLSVRNARLRARLTPDGGLVEGVFGGGIPLEDLYRVGAIAANDDQSVLPAIRAVFGSAVDLAPGEDGLCTQVSAALEFTAVSAFLF